MPADPQGVYVTNYEMLDEFEPDAFTGIVLDESSILKNRDGKTRSRIINDWKRCPYRLSCTATPSPNDYMELGNQSEFLGIMGMDEMLAMFFTHDGGDTSKWRLKGHGKRKFWEWLASWAVTIRLPSDLGFDDDGYILPALHTHEHLVASQYGDDMFTSIAQSLTERRQAKKETLDERVGKVAEIVAREPGEAWLIWCHTNDEADLLRKSIPESVEIRGSDHLLRKEDAINGFLDGRSEEHTSELQSRPHLVCRLLLEKKNETGSIAWRQPGARARRSELSRRPGAGAVSVRLLPDAAAARAPVRPQAMVGRGAPARRRA